MSNASARWWVGLSLLLLTASSTCAQSTYQGLTAEEWIARLERNAPAAAGALVAMGHEAVPAILRIEDPARRAPLVAVLARMGPEAREALPMLIELCRTTNEWGQGSAVEALGWIGVGEEAVVDSLIVALQDHQGAIRTKAARALGRLGPAARKAVPPLVKALDAYDYSVPGIGLFEEVHPIVDAAALALARVAPDSPEAQRALALRVGYPGMAHEALVQIGPASLPVLLDCLANRDAFYPQAIASVIEAIGPEAIRGLVEVAANPEAKNRTAALEALASLDPDPETAAPALAACLTDQDSGVRQAALQCLDDIALAPSIVSLLTARMNDEQVAGYSLRAFTRLGRGARAAVPAILPLLSHTSKSFRCEAATTLGAIGPGAASAAPALAELLSDPGCARQAAIALRQIGPEGDQVAEALVRALGSDAHRVPEEAAAALARMGPGGARRLADALDVHPAALGALAVVGEDAAEVALVIARRKEGNPPVMSEWARRTLLFIGPSAIPRLEAALGGDDARDRADAAEAIRALAPDLPEAEEALRRMQPATDPAVRAQGARGLASADLSTGEEVAALERALQDSNEEVAHAAWKAAVQNPAASPRVVLLLLGKIDRAERKDRAGIVWLIERLETDPRTRLDALRRAVDVDDGETRTRAVSALANLARDLPEAVPIVISLLDHSEDLVQWCAVRGAAAIGPAARGAAVALTTRLEGAEGSERADCLLALARVGAEADLAGPHLVDLWRDVKLRGTAKEAFRALGDGGIPWLIRLYDQADGEGRREIAEMVHELMPSSPRAVDLAMHILRENSLLIRDVAKALQPGPVVEPGASLGGWRLRKRSEEDVKRARRNVVASREVVRWLAEHLESRTTDLGIEAAEALLQLSPDIDEAFPELSRALGGDPSVAMRAMGALTRAGLKGAEAAAGALNDARPQARAVALDVIARVGAGAVGLSRDVGRMLEDPDPKVRRHAVLACARIGARDLSIVPSLATIAGGKDLEMALAALTTLRGVGPAAEEAVPAVALRLGDGDERVRLEALLALVAITPGDSATRAAVRAALLDQDADVRRSAHGTLIGWDVDSGEIVAFLIGALGSPEVIQRVGAARMLGELGQVAQLAVGPLAEALRQGPPTVRIEAARALGAIGVESREVFRALVGALGDGEMSVRAEAVAFLHAVTDPGEAAPHALIERLRDESELVRVRASHALLRFGPLSAADARYTRALHRSLLRDWGDDPSAGRLATCLARSGVLDDSIARCVLQRFLGGEMPADDPAISALLRDGHRTARVLVGVLAWAEPASRDRGIDLLRTLGEDASAAAPPLVALIERREGEADVQAMRILASVAPAAREAQDALWEALHGRDREVRMLAAVALARSGAPADRIVPILERELRIDMWPRDEAARALGELGPQARHALPTLWLALRPRREFVPDPHAAVALAEAIRAIDPGGTDPWPSALKLLRERIREPRELENARSWDESLAPAIGRLLEDDAADVRLGAARMLGAMGRRALRALDALERALGDADPEVREAVRGAIETIGR